LNATQEIAKSRQPVDLAELASETFRGALGPGLPTISPTRVFAGDSGEWRSAVNRAPLDSALLATLDRDLPDTLQPNFSYHGLIVTRPTDTTLVYAEIGRHGDRWVGFEVPLTGFRRGFLEPPVMRTAHNLRWVLDSIGRGRADSAYPISVRITTPDSITLMSLGPEFETHWTMEYPFTSAPRSRISVSVGPEAVYYLMPGGYPPAPGPTVAVAIFLALALLGSAAYLAWRMVALSRMREDFTSSVSHELRTPLANIQLYAETLLLERAPDPPARRAALETITRETRRLGDMVENLLTAARMARADEGIAPRAENLERLLNDVIDAFRPLIAAREIIIETDRLGDSVARVDGSAVRRILVNLLDNAIRHGPNGQRIRIVIDHAGGTVLIIVEDEGAGIPEHERQRIWRPYERGRSGGSGLGLAVVRHLARMHGGDAVVGETPVGARIEVRLSTTVAGSK
jgi:signal transduction histidine kinase